MWKQKHIQKLLMRQMLQKKCKSYNVNTQVTRSTQRQNTSVACPCLQWSSPCGWWPSCAFESSIHTKALWHSTLESRGKMNMSPFERPRLSTSSLLNMWAWEGTFFNAFSQAMLWCWGIKITSWNDLFYLRSSDEKWNVSSDQGRHWKEKRYRLLKGFKLWKNRC